MGATDSKARLRARNRLYMVSAVNSLESLDKSLWCEPYTRVCKQVLIAAMDVLRMHLKVKSIALRVANFSRCFQSLESKVSGLG